MSTYLGTTLLAGSNTETKLNAHSLFDFKFTDHKLNEMSWLRADTFSWQNGDVYSDAYNHLSTELLTATSSTETIGSYTITYYQATDGHKLVLTDMETTVDNIFNETGVAWYYIVDTTNTRFKLPRTKYGFNGLRDTVGNYISPGLPNITGTIGTTHSRCYLGRDADITGAFSVNSSSASSVYTCSYGAETGRNLLNFNASDSNSLYGASSTVQPPATQMYLYFYVGEFSQTAIEQTAGGVQEMVESKADLDLANTGRITNCITYIPQDINLTLSDGTLTVKSGSKIYIPNGSGTFNTVTLSSDVTTSSTQTGQFFAIKRPNNTFDVIPVSYCFSGTTAPTSYQYMYWYDTTNNLVKYTSDTGSTWASGYSFPVCIVTAAGSITSIDQVFNGFGYIGKTKFTLPGVKYLIPNGFNSDGSYKNIEVNTSSVVIRTTTRANKDGVLLASNTGGLDERSYYIEVNTYADMINTAKDALYYVKEYNMCYSWNGGTGSVYSSFAYLGNEYVGSSYIERFNIKKVFRSLDYNDKGIISGFSMPSNTYIGLTLGATGSTYTAPANGWFTGYFTATTASSSWFAISCSNAITQGLDFARTSAVGRYVVPVKKGDIITVTFGSATWTVSNFIYAEGEI